MPAWRMALSSESAIYGPLTGQLCCFVTRPHQPPYSRAGAGPLGTHTCVGPQHPGAPPAHGGARAQSEVLAPSAVHNNYTVLVGSSSAGIVMRSRGDTVRA